MVHGPVLRISCKNPLADYTTNKGGGSTVSVKKRGGWKAAWEDAQVLAGWQTKG